ncbi:pyruvate kinase [bacterium]|nr:pyruvate kinase [bacterium]
MSKTEIELHSKTKIVATLGPASNTEAIIKELITSGVSMFRLNTSHGSIEEHEETIGKIRKASKALNKFIPIMVDLQGPKIRVGNIKENINIKPGQEIVLKHTSKEEKGIIPVDYKGIADDVQKGDTILLDDGKVGLEVLKVKDKCVYAKVVYGAVIKPRKGINLPGSTKSLEVITERDKKFIEFAVCQNADYIALSFIRTPEDILKAKRLLKKLGDEYMPVIAKIEKPQAVENLEEIVKVTDGLMVARGDLGIEMSPQDVPIVQKRIITLAKKYKKVCIVATQMLESMIEEPIPTRAEASDVANAIIDGTDAVMLSAETAAGKHPVEAVKIMQLIAKTTEENGLVETNIKSEITDFYEEMSQAIANGAIRMAEDMGAKAILSFSHSGYTPKLLSKLKPSIPVMCVSDNSQTARRLNLFWDIYPYVADCDSVVDRNMLLEIDKILKEKAGFKTDDKIILIGSIPKLITGRTNFIRVHKIGSQK